jgi:hypothetical protein
MYLRRQTKAPFKNCGGATDNPIGPTQGATYDSVSLRAPFSVERDEPCTHGSSSDEKIRSVPRH